MHDAGEEHERYDNGDLISGIEEIQADRCFGSKRNHEHQTND